MSLFISFNFETGKDIAKAVSRNLRAQDLDAWWFDRPIPPAQLDSMIGTALANCTRCLVLLTKHPMSNWQMAEIVTIRHVFSTRLPAGMARECFIFARANNLRRFEELRPLFYGSEEIEFDRNNPSTLDLSFLDASPPALVPVTCGHGMKPRIILQPGHTLLRGHHLISGDFVPAPEYVAEKYCWFFLRDVKGKYYVQQPRPTITHSRRWAAPNIILGDNIVEVILVAVDDEAHRKIVNLVLDQSFGAIGDKDLIRSLQVVDSISFPATQ